MKKTVLVFVVLLCASLVTATGYDGTQAAHDTLFTDFLTGKDSPGTIVTVLDDFEVQGETTITKNVALAPDGSQSVPDYTFTGDPNTGIYSNSPDTLRFTIGGDGVLFLESGKVGVQKVPTEALDVQGKIQASGDVCSGTFCLDTVGSGSSQWVDGSGSDIYYNTGNVGIGTPSPGAKLEVTGEIRSNGAVASGSGVRIQTAGTTIGIVGAAGWIKGTGATDLGIFAETGKAITFMSGGSATDRMTIDSTGNVGIGTTSPDQKFQVEGGGAYGLGVVCGTSYCFHFNNNGWIYTGDTSGNVYGGVGLAAGSLWSDGDVYIGTIGGWASALLCRSDGTNCPASSGVGGSGTANYIPKWTAGSTLGNSVIFDNGNVGIGTASPSQKLHVSGNSLVTGNTYIGSTDTYFYRDSANRIATPDQFYVQSSSANTYLYSTNTYLGAGSGDTIRLRGNTFIWNQGVIQGNGNVGIGTTGPTEKLEVVGNIKASGDLTVTGGDITLSGTSQITAGGAESSYGALTIDGTKNGWGGINFRSGGTNYGTLMVSDRYSGFYNNADNNWDWYFDNGVLKVGTVQASQVTGTVADSDKVDGYHVKTGCFYAGWKTGGGARHDISINIGAGCSAKPTFQASCMEFSGCNSGGGATYTTYESWSTGNSAGRVRCSHSNGGNLQMYVSWMAVCT